ncbi:hypothetical protein Trydic_g22600 [Trypoxylus dichotomus]
MRPLPEEDSLPATTSKSENIRSDEEGWSQIKEDRKADPAALAKEIVPSKKKQKTPKKDQQFPEREEKKPPVPQKGNVIGEDSAQESQTIIANSDGEAKISNKYSLCFQIPSSGSEKGGSRPPKDREY